jgi:hypothetical protein
LFTVSICLNGPLLRNEGLLFLFETGRGLVPFMLVVEILEMLSDDSVLRLFLTRMFGLVVMLGFPSDIGFGMLFDEFYINSKIIPKNKSDYDLATFEVGGCLYCIFVYF